MMVCLLLKFIQPIQEKHTVNLYGENPVTSLSYAEFAHSMVSANLLMKT